MKKSAIICLVFLLLLTGCSTTYRVSTDSTKELTQELKKFSPLIEKVRLTFTRPDLSFRIDMSEEPSPEELGAILEKVKQFSTVENMSEIADSLGWGLEIRAVHLDIDTDGDQQTSEHAYHARYFKTSNASDYSEENIEAYKIWYETELDE